MLVTRCYCDILLMLGTDFPYRQFYPRGAGVRIAQVDVRPDPDCSTAEQGSP